MTPTDYKFAAEQAMKLLLDGYGVVARFRECALPRMGNHMPYELDGWLKHNADIVNKWHESKAKEREQLKAMTSDHQT